MPARLLTAVLCFFALAAPAHAAPQLLALGHNDSGQLGTAQDSGAATAHPAALPIDLAHAGDVQQISAGRDVSLALMDDGTALAFGDDFFGQLGNGTRTLDPNPIPLAVPVPGPAKLVATSGSASFVVTVDGRLFSFGFNFLGALGRAANFGTASPNPTPAQVTLPGATGSITQVAAGDFHTLVLTSANELYAFGDGSSGALGPSTNTKTATPQRITLPGASGPIVQIAAGSSFSMALTSTGQIFTWGDNRFGELGVATNSGTTNGVFTPGPVALPGATGPAVQIAAGGFHALVRTATGQVYSFGRNAVGELGRAANQVPNPTPAPIALPERAISVAAGTLVSPDEEDSLVLTASGRVFGFGSDAAGQIGAGSQLALPDRVGQIAAGEDHTLLIPDDITPSAAPLPQAIVGRPYRTIETVAGGVRPLHFDATGLPAGLTIDPPTGLIAGTPAAPSTTPPTITVTDANGVVASASPTLEVVAPPQPQPAPAPAPSSPGRAAPPAVPGSAPAASRHLDEVFTLLSWNRLRNGRTELLKLSVAGLVKGDRVALACKGKGCPRAVTTTARARTLVLTAKVRHKRLRPGAKLTITVTRPGFLPSVTTYTTIAHKDPRKTTR
jgi:alpha-tubulin suppressor-like RCC1 family protein